jgi:hypothetical protein
MDQNVVGFCALERMAAALRQLGIHIDSSILLRWKEFGDGCSERLRRKTGSLLVAGERFEPSTFGL